MSGRNPALRGAEEATARFTNNDRLIFGPGSAADAPHRHHAGHPGEQFHQRAPTASLQNDDHRIPAHLRVPPAGATPFDNQHAAYVAPRNPAEFLGMPFQGAMGVGGGAVDGFYALGHLASYGALQTPKGESDDQVWPPASAPLRTGSEAHRPATAAAAGEIELPAPHDQAQMEAFWRLMGTSSSWMLPPQGLMPPQLLPQLPPQLPPMAPAFPPGLLMNMELTPSEALDAVVKVEVEAAAAKEAEQKLEARRRQLRESQARQREKKRKAEQEKMDQMNERMETLRVEMRAAQEEHRALLAVQREYSRHLAIRAAILNGIDPAWEANQRQSATAAPWAAAYPPPQPADRLQASGFDEVTTYARQYVLTVRLAIEDALEDGLDAETVAAVEAAVRGGPDPRIAFLKLVRSRGSFGKALNALKYERPQPCADEGRWAAAAAAVVGRCPPDALLRLRQACSRANERRSCVRAALERVASDLDRLLPAEDGGMPCCWAAAATTHFNTAVVAASMAKCCTEINQIFQDIYDVFLKELGALISALVIANCEPDWPNWPAVAAQVVALAEQRGIIPPPSQAL